MIMPTPSRRPGSEPEGCVKAWFALCAVITLVNHFTP